MSPTRPAQPKVLISTLLSCLWPWFLAWSLLALGVLPLKLGEAVVEKWTSHQALGTVLRWIIRYFDVIWFLLATVTVYHYTIRREGLRTARRWGATVIPAVAIALWIGLRSGLPFGEFYYTSNLGWRMSGSPPAVAVLLWFTLIICCRYTALAILPGKSHAARAALGAGLLVATDLLLEQVAWKVRFYWMWPSEIIPAPFWPPVQNFVAWYVIAFGLLLALRGKPAPPGERYSRPVIVLALLCGVFLIARLANL